MDKSYFFEIPIENIIEESETKTRGFCNKRYLVYVHPYDSCRKIHVNTYYRIQGQTAELCIHYDRGLCGLTDYEKLSRKDIERQAYDSWMDGAK